MDDYILPYFSYERMNENRQELRDLHISSMDGMLSRSLSRMARFDEMQAAKKEKEEEERRKLDELINIFINLGNYHSDS